MFNYVIKGYGCNGAGESESWVEYSGTDRTLAFESYKKAKDWMGCATIDITVLGREWEKAQREEAEREALAEAEAEALAEFWCTNGPDINEYADGTLAFDEGRPSDRLLFEANHGPIVARYPYRDYYYSADVFASDGKFHSRKIEFM